jgi:hypothetical protein
MIGGSWRYKTEGLGVVALADAACHSAGVSSDSSPSRSLLERALGSRGGSSCCCRRCQPLDGAAHDHEGDY